MFTRFSWVTLGCRQGPHPICDRDLLDDPLAAVVPTLGSLVPGWLLVVPKTESLAFAGLSGPTRRDILILARNLAAEVKAFGRNSFILEHGPSSPASVVGCGVDQAHLHIVPLDANLSAAALADSSVRWTPADPQDPWDGCLPGQQYYLICGSDGSYMGSPRVAQSQYFRRKIAQIVGMPDAWDYREWPCHENVQRTIEHFAGAERQRRAA